jgi:hypothetical protein
VWTDDPAQWQWRVTEVPADQVAQVPGQSYGDVLREYRADPPPQRTTQPQNWRARRPG